jgi:hypothetical protein
MLYDGPPVLLAVFKVTKHVARDTYVLLELHINLFDNLALTLDIK